MNLESTPPKKITVNSQDDFLMEDFDFKPITSGLGFHQAQPADIKPAFTERVIPVQKPKEMTVYQNDLSMFYGQTAPNLTEPIVEVKIEKEIKTYAVAPKGLRVFAYLSDLAFVISVLSLVLMVISRIIEMNFMNLWQSYPNEITPLVLTLFTGFYFMYFSIFEKTSASTLGKNLFNLKVVTLENIAPSFTTLVLRSLISLLNFISLGLFSYFDLQNKVTQCKVVRKK